VSSTDWSFVSSHEQTQIENYQLEGGLKEGPALDDHLALCSLYLESRELFTPFVTIKDRRFMNDVKKIRNFLTIYKICIGSRNSMPNNFTGGCAFLEVGLLFSVFMLNV